MRLRASLVLENRYLSAFGEQLDRERYLADCLFKSLDPPRKLDECAVCPDR